MPKSQEPHGLRSAGHTLSAQICGESVYAALIKARPAGLTFRQIIEATQLSAHHARKGLNYVKDVLALANETPLTWTRADGFRLSQDPADWIAFEIDGLSAELTRITRVTTQVFAPHAAVLPGDAFAKQALNFIVGMQAGMEGIVAASKNQPLTSHQG